MGLSQDIRFEYENKASLEKFIGSLGDSFVVARFRDAFVISDATQSFKFEIWIEPFGIYTHRSGEYFYFLGVLIEMLTGEFGLIEVEDH